MTELLHRELTGAIIGVYYEVYNQTLRMYPEYIYESAMMEELRQRGYPTLRQGEYRIVYKERLVGVQRLDLFVVQEVVVENKVADNLTLLHKAQARSYLKTVGKQVGLVFNFGGVQPEFERVYLPVDSELTAQEAATRAMPEPSADWLYPELAYAIAGGLYEVHTLLGPGFIHRIYATANSSFVYGSASFDCGAKSAPPLRMLPYVNVETALMPVTANYSCAASPPGLSSACRSPTKARPLAQLPSVIS